MELNLGTLGHFQTYSIKLIYQKKFSSISAGFLFHAEWKRSQAKPGRAENPSAQAMAQAMAQASSARKFIPSEQLKYCSIITNF